MRATLSLILGVTALFMGNALAREETRISECRAVAWPFSRKQSREDFVRTFRMLERESLIEYLLAEVRDPKPDPVAYYLVAYLSRTESNRALRGFFGAVQWGAEIADEKSPVRRLEHAEVCDLLGKARKLASEHPEAD